MPTRFSYSRRALRWAGTVGAPWPPSERLAAGKKYEVHGGDGTDAQCVAVAASYGHPLVERIPLGGLQAGGADVVGELARHVEGDRQVRRRGVFLDGGVLGQEVGDGGADRG